MMMDRRKNHKKETAGKQTAKEKRSSLCRGVLGLILLLAADQLTKLLAYTQLRPYGPIKLLPGIFELHYLENQGAAFGMMENMQWVFILFAFVIVAGALLFYIRLPMGDRFRPLRILCITLSAGALGNMIDRITHHYVIDFLYFSLIDFPIFNVADIYVCVSTAILLLLLLFVYKDEDFQLLAGKKTKQEYLADIREKIEESREK
ncbi:MAG: signal peptidase II [Lachnospiraceae bacterium]|nr:signal peptidase II [Lachnospiraceae bacterium]